MIFLKQTTTSMPITQLASKRSGRCRILSVRTCKTSSRLCTPRSSTFLLRCHRVTLLIINCVSRFPSPNVRLPLMSSPVKRSATNISPDASCGCSVTPACLQSLYGIPSTPATQSSNKIGVSGFIDQYANKKDLQVYRIPRLTQQYANEIRPDFLEKVPHRYV